MKTLQKTLLALVAGSLMSVGAQAAVSYNAGQAYAGVKVGQYSPDESGVDDATSYGVYGGYKFTPEFGVEAEYLTTTDGDIEYSAAVDSEYSADVYGIYATYDYAFPNTALYAKGRVGFAKNEIDIDISNKVLDVNASTSISDTNIAGGIGLGYNLTPLASIEAMYNIYPTIEGDDGVEDLDISGITVGAHYKF